MSSDVRCNRGAHRPARFDREGTSGRARRKARKNESEREMERGDGREGGGRERRTEGGVGDRGT